MPQAIAVYGSLAFVQVMIDEATPLFYKLSVENGGLGWNEPQIGKLLLVGGVASILFCLGPLGWTQRKLGTIRTYRFGMLVVAPIFGGWWIVAPLEPIIGTTGVWLLSSLFVAIRAAGLSLSFTAAFIMVNNSVAPENLGKANAFGQITSSCCRALAPIVMGLVWSLGVKWRQVEIPFILIGVLCALQCLASFCLNPGLNDARIRENSVKETAKL